VRWRLTILALSLLARVSKRLTAGLHGRQRPCSSCAAAVNVFGQLSMAHEHAGLVVTTAWRCDRVRP